MISFLVCLALLIGGYFVYGNLVNNIFNPDDRETPAVRINDGVDYVVMPQWKLFLIQLLNIAGLGPIFGAMQGALWGPVVFLWITFGTIFAGGVHDFFSGMMSERNDGASISEVCGIYLGGLMQNVMRVFSVVLLVMVGTVFAVGPAGLIVTLFSNGGAQGLVVNKEIWLWIILAYYFIATFISIDKIIGKIYPLFAFSLLFMALALLVGLFWKMPAIPELWSNLGECNLNDNPAWLGADSFMTKNPIFPCLFITIACGAISGFHATQSPLMARCIKHEKAGRPIFYGAMITEGMVALIWATASMYFFYYGGWREVVDAETVGAFIRQQGEDGKTLVQFFDAPAVVKYICSGWLGVFGGVLAMLGVVAAPITSGDTAFRSARLIIAEAIGLEQRSVRKRLYVCLPLFGAGLMLLFWQMENPNGFNIIWQYFGWANQTLAVFTLWTITVYLVQRQKPFYVTLIPALFMTAVCSTFLLVSNQALGVDESVALPFAVSSVAIALVWFVLWKRKYAGKRA